MLMQTGSPDVAGADFCRIYAGGPHPSEMGPKVVAELNRLGWHWEPLRNSWVIYCGGKPGGEIPEPAPEDTCLG